MKIIGMKEFLKLPQGTMYQRFKPIVFGDSIEVFQGSLDCGNDFFYKNISNEVESDDSCEYFDLLHSATEKGTSFKFDYYCGSRDGHCCEDDQMFAIYEKEDVKELLDAITNIYNSGAYNV